MEEEKNLSQEAPAEEKPEKSNWQKTKEGWYDKIPVTLLSNRTWASF